MLEGEFKPWENGISLNHNSNDIRRWSMVGLDALKNKKIAYCLMAGGQGTRLGCVGPKGLVDPGLPTPTTLFKIQANRFIHFCSKYNCPLPKWLIMTSDATHYETIQAFKENNFYGYDQNKVFFFKQANLPSLGSNEENLYLKGELVQNPDGSGGIIPALHESGLASELFHTFIEFLIIYNVDNLLVNLPDATYAGFLIETQLDASAKAIKKVHPHEAVGVFAINQEKKPCVLEYTDTPKHLLSEFNMGNAGIYAFSTQFIMQMRYQEVPRHRSWKKVIHDGDLTPNIPNAWKEETFIFDWYPYTNKFMWWEIEREDEFAPLKNAEPNPIDSPLSARLLWNQKWRNKLREYGVKVSKDVIFDISPEVEFWNYLDWQKWIQNNPNELLNKTIQIKKNDGSI